jgi:NADH-quinone oxidoreductase subunit L
MVATLAWAVLLAPLAGFAILLAAGRRLGPRAGWLATATVVISFAASVGRLVPLLGVPGDAREVVVGGYTWIAIGGLELTTDLLVDPLSVTMILLVTGVGALVHLYSIGYMHGDPGEPRYFAFLNLFVFSMLLLVLAANLVVLFVGWELVGLCSYLLIGFWFEEARNAVAAKKAFIVNRVGDVSFALGLFLIFLEFGSLAMPEVLPAASEVLGGQEVTATVIGLLLLGGAIGKSAQIPLYVWLPDAMAGPTPVSALIHAATMVTAGVYMVARVSPIYLMGPGALEVVAIIGIATALVAAIIAVQQDDIKMVLAYSTVSQLGYMFVGVGVGAFGIGIFHLVTHGFFKALLFLAAGSVMHAVANRTDMWQMGGLRKAMPITFATSVVAVLAISGVPPFAGFFSKDQILHAAFEGGYTVIWFLGLVTAGITAFYMGRWLVVPFLGEPRWASGRDAPGSDLPEETRPEAGHTEPGHAEPGHGEEIDPHEAPPTMTIPLVALAVLSVVGGWINWVHPGPFERWLEPAAGYAVADAAAFHLPDAVLIGLAVVVALAGLGLAWLVYGDGPRTDPLPARLGAAATAMREKFWVDEVYSEVFFRGGGALSHFLVWFDVTVIDGAVDGVGRTTRAAARGLRRLQPGLVRLYVAGMILGTVVIVAAFLVQVV